MLLITIQQELVLLDLENTREVFNGIEKAHEFYQIGLCFSICILVLMISQNYNVRGVTLFQYIHTCVFLYLLGTRNIEELNPAELYIIRFNWVYFCAGIGIYLFLHRNWVNTFTTMSANIIDAVSLF
jgi:hypothetical protein